MSRYSKKIGGRRRSRRNKSRTRKCLKKCKRCRKSMNKNCKKYCRICMRSRKKYHGGAKSGSYVLKPAGYSINTNEVLHGKQSSLANPPPYTAYKM